MANTTTKQRRRISRNLGNTHRSRSHMDHLGHPLRRMGNGSLRRNIHNLLRNNSNPLHNFMESSANGRRRRDSFIRNLTTRWNNRARNSGNSRKRRMQNTAGSKSLAGARHNRRIRRQLGTTTSRKPHLGRSRHTKRRPSSIPRRSTIRRRINPSHSPSKNPRIEAAHRPGRSGRPAKRR